MKQVTRHTAMAVPAGPCAPPASPSILLGTTDVSQACVKCVANTALRQAPGHSSYLQNSSYKYFPGETSLDSGLKSYEN